MNSDAGTVSINIPIFSIAIITLIFTIGVAWGTMNNRINNLEKRTDDKIKTVESSLNEKLSKELFAEFRQNIEGLLKGIRGDMLDLRRSIHTLIGQHDLEIEREREKI
jgi:hypothetical protein